MILTVLYVFVVGTVSSSWALDNGLARTPPMGWNTWVRFRCTTDCKRFPKECISENLILRTADVMVNEGYRDAGYNYIAIQECWQAKERDSNGRLVPDRQRFPHGMKYIADYLHRRGLKLGISADYTEHTCFGNPGSFKHEQIDMDTFASWEIDYLMLDGCSTNENNYKGYSEFRQMLNKTGRPILYSCSWPAYQEPEPENDESLSKEYTPNYEFIAKHCNMWFHWDEIQDSFYSVTALMDSYGHSQHQFAQYVGPGHWNDFNMLIIGNFGLSEDQARVQMAVWAIMAVPLFISANLATMKREFKAILLNKDIIKINQDPLGKPGLRVWVVLEDDSEIYSGRSRSPMEIWTRELYDGSYAVAFVSKRDEGVPYEAYFTFKEMKVPGNLDYEVYNLYKKEGMRRWKSSNKFEVRVNPSGVKFYKFVPERTNQEHVIPML